ncbi:MAG: hypothetical protein Q8O38_10740 [Sulfurimicrobium sp.]|nr:hypothetical protein [Sulfurimicrobium sp.]
MTETNSRKCVSCSSEVSADASKCPKCGEWREDIKKERNLCYLFSFLALIPIFVFFYGKSHRWWLAEVQADRSNPFAQFVPKSFALMETFDWSVFFS